MRPSVSSTARVCAKCRRAPPSVLGAGSSTTRCLSTSTLSSRPIAGSASRTSTPFADPSSSTTVPSRWLSQTARLARPEDQASSSRVPETHYDFFPEALPDGPPPKGHFPIDQRALRREFLQLQAKAHPDMHPADLKPRAEATSARINEAYKTLSNPLLRAQYLLGLRGVDVANDETLKVEDPELLMSVLEAREAIEEASDEADLEPMRAENDERVRESEEVLEKAFAGDDIETAKKEAVKLRYWVNIKDSLDGWEKGKPVVLEH